MITKDTEQELHELKEKYNSLIKRIREISESCIEGYSQCAEEFCHEIAMEEDKNYEPF